MSELVGTSATLCAWCELPIDTSDRQSVRLSNTQPPWSARSLRGAAGVIAAVGLSMANVLRPEPAIVLWFHRACWRDFLRLLQGRSADAA